MFLLWARLLCTEALRALSRHKMRNALAALGIMIGTGAVVCVVAIGQAGSARAEAQLANLGNNFVWVEAGGRNVNGVRTGSHGTSSLTTEDMDAILRDVHLITRVSPNVDGHFLVEAGNRNWTTQYRGVNADFMAIRNWPLAEGSPFTQDEIDRAENVCLLGATVRRELFGDEDVIGKSLRTSKIVCDVIGVLAVKGQAASGQDQDDTILLPFTTVQRKIRGKGYTWLDDIMCSAVSMEAVEPAVVAITSLLRERHHIRPGEPDDFNIRRPDDVIKTQIEAKHTLAVFLVSIATVSLLVGGIGIMNVMLASVSERTREIGVRLAVGAKEWAVQVQFLIEAAMLSFLGGVFGALLGLIATWVIGWTLEWPTVIPVGAVVGAPAFSAAVGLFFGFYPARRASRLDPINALRSE